MYKEDTGLGSTNKMTFGSELKMKKYAKLACNNLGKTKF
jgi:hypothetical protein